MFIDTQLIIEIGIVMTTFGIGFLTRECIQIPINNRLWYIRRRIDIYIDRLLLQIEILKKYECEKDILLSNLEYINNNLQLELKDFYGVKL